MLQVPLATQQKLSKKGNDTTLRFKIIRPVYEELVVSEAVPESIDPKQPISSAAIAFAVFGYLTRETREHFLAVHLDSKNRILAIDCVSTGSLNASIVHPRELFKTILLSSAAAVLLVHNHPSGDPTPSREDHELTSRLKECSELLGIRLLDHIVIGNGCYTSFADQGWL